jgi:hypothetical protein
MSGRMIFDFFLRRRQGYTAPPPRVVDFREADRASSSLG